jgi:hypothetical protein
MHQFKAPIAGNSKAIAKIGNAELVHFNKQMLTQELIRGSLAQIEASLSTTNTLPSPGDLTCSRTSEKSPSDFIVTISP